MCRTIEVALDTWQSDANIALIIIEGADDSAFVLAVTSPKCTPLTCAGITPMGNGFDVMKIG